MLSQKLQPLVEIRVIFDKLITYRISKFKLILTERRELIQVEKVLSIRDLTKLVLTGEESQNRAQTPTTAFHIVGILFHNRVIIPCVEIKCTAIFFKHFTDITLIFYFFYWHKYLQILFPIKCGCFLLSPFYSLIFYSSLIRIKTAPFLENSAGGMAHL